MRTFSSRFAIGSLVLSIVALAGPATSGARWTFLPPATVGVRDDVFSAVDGTAADDIWAVGAWEPPDWNSRCLIEHFDGVSWAKLPVPAVGLNERLRGVLAVSRDRALAVGTYRAPGSTTQPLAMEWDGAAWARIPVPEFPGGRWLNAIDQTPGGEIWVAGYQAGTAFIAHRTQGGWTFENAPPVVGGLSIFHGIHAAADNQIWVVGEVTDELGSFRILIQRYDGNSSWTTFDVPTPGLEIDQLSGVLALAPGDVWAVGEYYQAQHFNTQPLIMHYDGTSWTQVQLPDYPEGPALLRGMAARAPDDIYAAGTYGLGPSPSLPRPFMLHYDGSTWSDVVLPPTSGVAEWFLGMGANSNGDVWAVGQYSDGSSMEPMAFRGSPATTAVDGRPALAPAVLATPNPMTSEVRFRLTIPTADHAQLSIYDTQGRRVATLLDRRISAGEVSLEWHGEGTDGRRAAAGTYFYRFTLGLTEKRGRLVLLR